MPRQRPVGLFFLPLLLLCAGPVSGQDEPRVTRFTPQGTVKQVRQVRAVFSQPMAAFGDPRAADPFAVDSPEPGRGRWVDPRTWVYDFDRDLPAGVRCGFRAVSGLRDLAGRPLAGPQAFAFNTGGPAVRFSSPADGTKGVSEDQVFLLALDAPADEASVLAHAGFEIAGIRERVGVRVVAGEQREAILAAQPWILAREPDRSRLLLVQCRQAFPVQAKVSLVWGRGVRTASGVANEADQRLHFEAREPFLAEFRCERENPRAACIPILPMRLSFNAPLDPAPAGDAVLRGPAGKTWKAPIDSGRSAVEFPGPFPENAEFILEIPAGLKDDAGRSLLNADRFPLKLRTAAAPPLAKFAGRFGVVELKGDPVLPVTLRNLEPRVKARMLPVAGAPGPAAVDGKMVRVADGSPGEIQAWLRKVAAAGREDSLLAGVKGARSFAVPKPRGAKAFEVVGIPLNQAGFYVVELESVLLGRALLEPPPKPMFVPAAVLVTNLAVHFKRGRESSLVWVTTLDRGEPAAGAAVSIADCAGRVLWEGRTDGDGIARVAAELPAEGEPPACPYDADGMDYPQLGALRALDGGLFVTARLDGDLSFVHSSWNEGIETWQFRLPTDPGPGPVVGHTVFDRTLIRAGETVHMKHFLRSRTQAGFAYPSAGLPQAAVIRHAGSDQVYRLPLAWGHGAVAESSWSVPRDARLGTYTVALERGPQAEKETGAEGGGGGENGADRGEGLESWPTGRFRVEEFRIPLLKAALKPPAAPLVNAAQAPVDLSVQFLSGGGASRMPVRLRYRAAPRAVPAFDGWEGFAFANGGLREGVVRRGEAPEADEGTGAAAAGPTAYQTVDLTLDAAGTGRAVLPLPAAGSRPDTPAELVAEMEFRDPNGEVQTVSERIPLWNAKVLAGIAADGWALSKEALQCRAAVVDLAGRPVAGAPVKIELYERKRLSHRKRLAGGFYAYDHSVATRRVQALCEGRTDSGGRFACEASSPVSGELVLVVEARDDAGNRAAAHREVWVAGRDEWWFAPSDHDRMDLLPERRRYEPGETAVFQVRMPFREATALVAVEREGVMEAWTRRLAGRAPVIEVPVLGNYAPNVFVSVLAVRGRVAEPPPTALADLGKPACKLGLAAIDVGWRAHELKVSVAADQAVYRVREKARVGVMVATAEGKAPPPGGEVAVAVVDEGLLELMPNRSWELLPAMMARRGCEVETATAQMHVVGKRHFGLKAALPGGGGGRQGTRELFDTLLLWRPRVALDAHGRAEIEVPLNDALTSFRIVAVASAGTGLFGTGAASIRTTQDLMVLPGIPPLAREGDRIRAAVTVRNTTERAMAVEAAVRAEGLAPPPAPLAVELSAGEAREIGWEADVPAGRGELAWEIEVAARGGGERDRLRVVQKIVPAVPLEVQQAALLRLEAAAELAVERPAAALPGGGVRVEVRPRIGGGLSALRDFMRRYPYGCLEQKASRAVALGDADLWRRLQAELPAHLDGDGLAKYFPSLKTGDPVLTAYLVAISHAAGFDLPPELRARMAAGLRAFVDGTVARRSALPAADLTLRKLAALEALSRIGAAEPRLLDAIAVEPHLWPTSAVLDWVNILLNLEAWPQRRERLAEAEAALRARMNLTGTNLGFSTAETDSLWWLMASGDVNAVRLVLTALRLEGWGEELPRMVKAALARQRRGHWDLTVANAWGALALARFSERFESAPVAGETRAALAPAAHSFDWAAAAEGGAVLLPWPAGKGSLQLAHAGSGAPWATVQSLAAVPRREAVASGYRIVKTTRAVERRAEGRWSRGDILRVRLDIEAQADMTWVVVSDPIPAGAAILGSGLGRDAALAARGDDGRPLGVQPAFEERSFEAFRAYYEFVPRGRFAVEYTLRLNQDGRLQVPPTRVEALYAPEMHAELPNALMEVDP
jgi:uncharacterized protein YfaS (alpha-2-macroglobulin family)